MTHKQIIATLLLALWCTIAATAQDFGKLRQEADASQAAVTSPGAACNQTEETFSQFIVKFTVDQSFNTERSKLSRVFALKNMADYKAYVVTQGHDAGYIQKWDVAGPDKVNLSCGFAGMPADYVYQFLRKDGKWYLDDRITGDF